MNLHILRQVFGNLGRNCQNFEVVYCVYMAYILVERANRHSLNIPNPIKRNLDDVFADIWSMLMEYVRINYSN